MRMRPMTVLVLALIAAVSARGDDITLKDGSVLRGKITIETDDKIVLQLASGRQVVDRSDIASIERAPFAMPESADTKTAAPKADVAAAPAAAAAPDISSWPPRPGQPYPDLALLDSNGNLFKLSSLKGKVILVEPVGMTCVACQALSGGHKRGGYLGIAPQSGIDSLEDDLARFGNGLKFETPGIAYVQIVIFNMNMQAPSVEEVKAWADHFNLSNRPNVYVLVGTKEMTSEASFDMIPGVHLIDRDFVLRSEHFGHGGGSDLYRELLPLAGSYFSAAN
jgi:hypothetical protein